eukprot:CAMPEP_0168729800 /NCGR_PEP_ID=MMETSP0724-20121128/6401_1 /TAXON_ID=265536 /ORGANISM="Amphiprora sp., Strain CCMP467" /LENGTH=261 /DNA_ID=CAMNT_0008776717 /DNA_START=81 /DNA_END=869 /DNA_ORIENTATION=+
MGNKPSTIVDNPSVRLSAKKKEFNSKKVQKIRRRTRSSVDTTLSTTSKTSIGGFDGEEYASTSFSTSANSGTSKRASNSNTFNQGAFNQGEVVVSIAMNDPVPDDAPEALRLVREFIRYKDTHDISKMKEYLNMDRCDVMFHDSDTEFPVHEYLEACKNVFDSFPDMHYYWKKMSVLKPEPDVGTWVVVEDYYGIGTHTGAPFSFGPYEPIPATAIKAKDDFIEHGFLVNHDGLISKSYVKAFGKIVGPPGFYQKIGGLII